jgi:CBS domain-containing protein/gamma-glutamyl:cysteine ligase YbdK (ATP-grasp superfamily)
MGEFKVSDIGKRERRAKFIKNLLDDLECLDIMLKEGMVEDDRLRIGAEQEFCLVTEQWRPATTFQAILDELNDEHFTTELAQYNLELNLDPIDLGTNCFSKLEENLRSSMHRAEAAASKHKSKTLLTGILPTISLNELELEYMTPADRYYMLNQRLKELRGGDFHISLKGVDDLSITHDSVLFEACNTSFQMHLQVKPSDFVASYNWAQAISGPVMGISVNSPLLLGRELWNETRIALFQQSIDTRFSSYALKNQVPRVTYGNEWSQGSIVDIYKSDVVRHKAILAREINSNSKEDLKAGKVPKLEALCVFNGTIYRWNRPCYGVSKGKPHLRIENRYIPSGPSILDEVANFAFWVGLMHGRPKEFDDLPGKIDFRDAKSNFLQAARSGKQSVMVWRDTQISVRDLVEKELLPLAENGLKSLGIDKDDIERYLEVIEQRTKGQTGSRWMIRNYRHLNAKLKTDDALMALTKHIYQTQQKNAPIHEWKDIEVRESAHEDAHLVHHIMSTQLVTINEKDLAELAIRIMQWEDIHHLPVVNEQGELTGLLTWRHMQKFMKENGPQGDQSVTDIMTHEVFTVRPKTEISAAINIMKRHEFGCLPVVSGRELVGIITIDDVINFAND